jgi:nitrite reductase (cytochrome c-552)
MEAEAAAGGHARQPNQAARAIRGRKKVKIERMAVVALAALCALVLATSTGAAERGAPKPDVATCYGCHDAIKDFHTSGKHKTLSCSTCHQDIDKHLADAAQRPGTQTDLALCGSCHKLQYESFATMNWHKPARFEKSQMTGPSPNPAWDKLMMPHGFTKEHNLPRSHTFALIDQLLVDRSFGGRFAAKDGWQYLARSGDQKLWSVLEDKYPGQDHKAFRPGTAAAANPVCLSCKSQDHILSWAYMGEPVKGAKWSRVSKVNEMVKDLNNAVNCIYCHDPHAAKPRIVRDGLIQALTRPEADTLWHKDPNATRIDVKDLGMRGFTRKIAMLEKYDTKLQCAQCHVEYNCNPGTDPTTGQPIGMADARTNHFPLKDVTGIAQHYTDLKFRDFKHAITGALLWKSQHPDVETYWNSKHDKAGVQCQQCHMPKVKDAKTGKTYTSHWQTNPKNYLKETCLTCHTGWNETKARYVIESLAAYVQGKTRKAEFWLTRLVDKFEEANAVGLDEAVLNAARNKHYEAHVNWEWWTSTNGAGMHNPDAAAESLNRSMALSQEGIKILDDGLKARRATLGKATVTGSAQ